MSDTPLKTNVLTDRLLRSWIRCRRKAWLDLNGDSRERLWTAHRTLQLDHQQRSFVALMPNKPEKGLEACKKGAQGVLGLRLKGNNNSGQQLEAHPPLLQRIIGTSIWGDFSYRPVIARQGRRLTREHRLTLGLYSLLLNQLQHADINEGLAVSATNNGLQVERVFIKEGLKRDLSDVLNKLNEDLDLQFPPKQTSDRRKCNLCSWRGICSTEAAEEGHLNEISGIGARRLQILQDLGIKSITDLAAFDPVNLEEELTIFGEQHSEIAMQVVAQAKAQKGKYYERITKSKALPELEKAPGVLLYDIESDPDQRDNFLHGFVSLKHRRNNTWELMRAKYHPMLMLIEHGEALAWQRIKRKLAVYPEWPILHYGETEALSLCRLASRQGASKQELDLLRKRLIDVHARLRTFWRLPLNNYGLKTVACWTGFRWKQTGADGARALLWWRKWRGINKNSSGSNNLLKWIFNYNHDDCLASWAVAEWMLKQDQCLASNCTNPKGILIETPSKPL